MSNPSDDSQGIFPGGAVVRASPRSYEELREFAAFWKLQTSQLQPGRYEGQLKAVHTPHMQLAVARHGCGTRIGGEVPKNTLVLSFPLTAGVSLRFRGAPLGSGEMCIHDARHGLDFWFHAAIEVVSLAVDRERLERRAATLWQCDPGTISSGLLRLRNPSALGRLRHLVQQTLRDGLGDPGNVLVGAGGDTTGRRLIDGFLEGVAEPAPVGSPLARRWLARRAAEVIEERYREDIDIADLCAAVNASRRTLHLGFLEVFGIPPMQYLRVVRLNAVRRELRSARSSGVPLTRIATDCGFAHLGRFSASYESFFGVLPSKDTPRPES